jgi:hypothetical protein
MLQERPIHGEYARSVPLPEWCYSSVREVPSVVTVVFNSVTSIRQQCNTCACSWLDNPLSLPSSTARARSSSWVAEGVSTRKPE